MVICQLRDVADNHGLAVATERVVEDLCDCIITVTTISFAFGETHENST